MLTGLLPQKEGNANRVTSAKRG